MWAELIFEQLYHGHSIIGSDAQQSLVKDRRLLMDVEDTKRCVVTPTKIYLFINPSENQTSTNARRLDNSACHQLM